MNREILILDDEYIDDVSNYIKNTTWRADMQLSALLNVLEEVVSSGIAEGETADALRDFIKRAEALNGLIFMLGDKYCSALEKFKNDVYSIDTWLYKI